MQRLHNSVTFVYGVIVGLAIREALVRTVPDILHLTQIVGWRANLEAFRLVLFLSLIVRFYFGSGTYFESVYLGENAPAPSLQTRVSYGIDFSSGLVHFLVFFAWSLTLTDHNRPWQGTGIFLWVLAVILAFDAVWYFANPSALTKDRIKLWAEFNLATLILAGILFFGVRAFTGNDVLAEECSFPLIALVSLIDYVELISGRDVFARVILRMLPSRFQKENPTVGGRTQPPDPQRPT